MKMRAFLPLVCAALVPGIVSCSQNSGGYADAETARAVADGTMPPWMAEYSDPVYETGNYTPAAQDSYAYNPPPKPSTPRASANKKKPASKPGRKPSSRNTGTRTYIVKKGDTLGAIARRHGTSVRAIKNANGLKSDLIRINQKLKIPRGK